MRIPACGATSLTAPFSFKMVFSTFAYELKLGGTLSYWLRHSGCAIICVVASFSSTSIAQVTQRERARAHLQDIIYSDKADTIESRLADNGLLTAEIQARSERTAAGYAECLIDFFESRSEKGFENIIESLANGVAEYDLGGEFGEEDVVFTRVIEENMKVVEGCIVQVHQFLGIPGKPVR